MTGNVSSIDTHVKPMTGGPRDGRKPTVMASAINSRTVRICSIGGIFYHKILCNKEDSSEPNPLSVLTPPT